MLKVIEIFRTRDELDKLVNLPNTKLAIMAAVVPALQVF